MRDATFCRVGGSTAFCRGSDSFAKSENGNGVVLRKKRVKKIMLIMR